MTVTDGVETGREALKTAVTRKPVPEQVSVGTKPRPGQQALGRRPELGGARAVRVRRQPGRQPGGTYRGLYQFSRQTWAASAARATRARRAERADLPGAAARTTAAARASGGCGRHLFD